ncbi:hypothetical protein EDB81DRAFT_908042 [Dactylonectria macrodidyma]|uniref:Uncharacterized protein n=1 Tax=Dactylonectria macrodidyma TaxID=307937 RepID=A0A9P9DZ59_9HYPO|nr:hypothetical protein EDB81DRAFT_908042 [Dactylonectria macrodidyma]
MLFRAIFVSSLCSLVVGETFDLGDVEQYKGDSDPGNLNGGSVLLTRGESDGLRIELGTDTQAKVKSAIDGGCADLNNECYQGVYNVLNDAELEFDGQYEKRELVTLVSRSAGVILAVVFAVVGIIIEYNRLHNTEESMRVVNIPVAKASEASVFGSYQPVTVSAQGSAIVTVTPTPDPTSLQGQIEPTVVPITEAIDGYQPGDFMAKLDPDLAARIDEIMHRTSQCQDGSAFDSSHPASRKRDPGTLGNAICGAQGAAAMAQPGGTLNDILLINGPTFHFRAAEFAAAAQQVVNFVRDWAPILALDPAMATEVGQTLFILAVDTLMNGVPLAAENPVKQDLVEEGEPDEDPSITTTTDCPRPTECVVNCDGAGDKFYICETDCQTKTDECATDTSNTMLVTTTATHEWDAYATASSESGEDLQAQDPECENQANRSNFPVKVFYDVNSDQNVVHQFCDEVGNDQGSSLSMIVDSHGSKLPNLRRRSPPANADDYQDYKVSLTWEPAEGADMASCPKSCKDVWYGIAQGGCGSASGQATSMTVKGSQNIGCGTYGWEILSPQESSEPEQNISPLEVGPIQCRPREDGHSDTTPSDISMGSKLLCGDLPEDFGPDTTKWQKDINGWMQGHPMTFSVEWEQGCKTTVDSQNAKWPVGDHDAAQQLCYFLFLNNWQNCDNGGNGGSTKVGCLVYTYYPR